MSDSEGRGVWAFLVVVGGIYFASDAIDWGFMRSRISHYTLHCSTDPVDGKCLGKWYQGSATEYLVNSDEQTVVSQSEGQPPSRLVRCAVIDRKNWKCAITETGEYFVGFTDGQYWAGSVEYGFAKPVWYSGVKSVARWEWRWADKPPQKR